MGKGYFGKKMILCQTFFNELAYILRDKYTPISNPNGDTTAYLIPNGTEKDLSYYSKPANSFRVSYYWSWYCNIHKCKDPHYIQCANVDLPLANLRPSPGHASMGKNADQVAVIGSDGKYHVVYGEKYDRKTKTWSWVNNDPANIAEMVLSQIEAKKGV